MTNETAIDWNRISDGVADAIESAGPAIVRVFGRRHGGSTGTVWSAEEGLVVAANHCLRKEGSLHVQDADGRVQEAELVGRDRGTDLALVRVAGGLAARAAWTDSRLRVGHLVVALGRPGKTVGASFGMVGRVGDAWRTGTGGRVDQYIQVDAGLPRGFSGGPLISLSGQVLGINTSRLTRAGATLPTSTVQRVVERLARGGAASGPGYLGIGCYPVTLPDALAAQLGRSSAVLVVSLEPGGPAERAGLALGDIVHTLGDAPIADIRDVHGALADLGAGTEVTAQVVRGGESLAIDVELASRPTRSRGCG